MYLLKATALVSVFVLSAVLVAQQDGSSASQQNDTSLSSTPTPQVAAGGKTARREADPGKQTKRLVKLLGLSGEQAAQLRPIIADRDRQLQQVRGDGLLSPRDRRARLQAIQQNSTAKIEALLNDTQKHQYEQMQAAQRDRMRRGPKS